MERKSKLRTGVLPWQHVRPFVLRPQCRCCLAPVGTLPPAVAASCTALNCATLCVAFSPGVHVKAGDIAATMNNTSAGPTAAHTTDTFTWTLEGTNNSKEIFELDGRYADLRPIRAGAYGFVAAAEDTIRKRPVAIKKVANFLFDLEDAKRVAREIQLLVALGGNAGVIDLLDVATAPANTTDFRDVYIICPLMESDLERIISSSQPLTDAHAQYFMYQLLRSLKYIHSAGVIHRDLKPGNLLVNANCDLCVCDFGLARGDLGPTGENVMMTEYVVTRWYRAPELLLLCNDYSTPIDVWSAGCILAELLGRRPLFPGQNYIHQLELIVSVLGSPSAEDMAFVSNQSAKDAINRMRNRPPTDLSLLLGRPNPQAVDLLTKLLTFDPRKRYTVEQALQHPWLAGYRDESTEVTAAETFQTKLDHHDAAYFGRGGLQSIVFNQMLDLKAQAAGGGGQEEPPLSSPLGVCHHQHQHLESALVDEDFSESEFQVPLSAPVPQLL